MTTPILTRAYVGVAPVGAYVGVCAVRIDGGALRGTVVRHHPDPLNHPATMRVIDTVLTLTREWHDDLYGDGVGREPVPGVCVMTPDVTRGRPGSVTAWVSARDTATAVAAMFSGAVILPASTVTGDTVTRAMTLPSQLRHRRPIGWRASDAPKGDRHLERLAWQAAVIAGSAA